MVRLGYFHNVGAVSVDSDHTTKITNEKCREVPKTQYVGAEFRNPDKLTIKTENTALKGHTNM